MLKIGYARVSTPTQNLDRQIGALRAERCDKIFREKASGKDIKNRPLLVTPATRRAPCVPTLMGA
jgi:DNA invertase Pin-like site-specific DNA recombinase